MRVFGPTAPCPRLIARSAAGGYGSIVPCRAPISIVPSHAAAFPRRAPHGRRYRYTTRKFERVGDGASMYLPRPGEGGFDRSSFLGRQSHRDLEDQYELGDALGKGGMGVVKAATHRETGAMVAVKMVAKSNVEDVEAMKRELKFLKVADHPNVVRLYSTYEDDDNLLLVMEYCEGRNLGELIAHKHEDGAGFTEAELVDTAHQALRAVAYCHTHAIVHRDIKPQNFICASCLKLVDFGVSGVIPHLNPINRVLTVKTGTDGFMAPELLLSQTYGHAADMFSLGVTLYNMVTGQTPSWIQSLGQYQFPRSKHLKELSAEGQGLIGHLLAPNPKHRPTAVEALEDPWFLQRETAARQAAQSTFLDTDVVDRLRTYSRMTKLQKCARICVAAVGDLSHPGVDALERAFIAVDGDNDGEVQIRELTAELQLTGEAEDMIARLDCSRSGTIGFSEWLAAAAPASFFLCEKQQIIAFDVLDAHGTGYIGAKDVQKLLPNVFRPGELNEKLKNHDPSGDGIIDFEDFCELLEEEPVASPAT